MPNIEIPRFQMTLQNPMLGIVGESLEREDQLAEFFGVQEGVLVRSVKKGSAAEKEAKEQALAAKSDFFHWHMLSLGLNLATFVLVAVALALAAQLPEKSEHASSPGGTP